MLETCKRAGHWWEPAGKRSKDEQACKRCKVKRPKEKSGS